jgi:rhodanese-related sulfurtransferase
MVSMAHQNPDAPTTTTPHPPAGGHDAVTEVAPAMLREWLDAGDTVLVDVREFFERAAEHIPGSAHAPLSSFDPAAVRAAHPTKEVVFHCVSGKRSAEAAEKYRSGGEAFFHLAGGIEAWKAAGLPVTRPATAPRLPIMRQVQITAGGAVALGVGLGVTLSPWFLALSAFVGLGLVFAGITGWCGLARVLAAMPWNRNLANTASCSAS